VRQYAPDGSLLQEITLPVSCPTKCAFGGPQLEDLFITTSRAALEEEEQARQPHAGGLFVVRPGARGRRAREFRA
jgi:L-arabinonolactonase